MRILLISLFFLAQTYSSPVLTKIDCHQKSDFVPNFSTRKFDLTEMPYSYDFLEPILTTQMNSIHHQKHHDKYVRKLNAHIETQPEYVDKTLAELQVLAAQDVQLEKYAGGHYNHAMYWWVLTNPSCTTLPEGKLASAIQQRWGSVDKFNQVFADVANSVFGSGYAWLCVDSTGDLAITTTANQINPLMKGLAPIDCIPILGIDIWEHAYYLKYLWDKETYFENWTSLIDWAMVEYFYDNYASKGKAVPV
jgi:Fe-Mn family superoxide dismutase